MPILICADSVLMTSAWIVSSTDGASVAPNMPKANENNLNKMPQEEMIHKLMYKQTDAQFPAFCNLFVNNIPPSLAPQTTSSSSSWSHSIQDNSIPCTYHPVWKWQTEYFQQHLHNFRQVPLSDPSLAEVISEEKNTIRNNVRVRTKWFASDEYRLIRMTYMDGGISTQIFTTVCYPNDVNLPIMGHGLMQVGDRRIVISDFTPLQESHKTIAKEYLQPIQQQHTRFQQPISERFFQQEDDLFWSDYTLVGRFSMAQDAEEIWTHLWPAYQACVKTHVQLCQDSSTITDAAVVEREQLEEQHARYDVHVSSRDPAIQMLARTFGKKMATKIVYQTLFPLADPPSAQWL